jgi:hypothetical protein
MGSIKTSDAQGLITKKLVGVYQEIIKPTSFIRSFFKNVESPTRAVSIEVQRGFEKIAVDVVRGTEGNRNTFGKSTEKIFEPPYHREYFDATQIDLYDKLYGVESVDSAVFARYINNVADKIVSLQNKIERKYEKLCSDVLVSGVLNFDAATSINFKRKAESIVDLGSGQYFANAIDPFKKIASGCKFLRTVGKSGAVEFNAILGTTALIDLFGNATFLAKQDLINFRLDSVKLPIKNAVGGDYLGTIFCAPYNVNLWTYPEFYDDKEGVSTPFIDDKKLVLLPSDVEFIMAFGAVPQLIEPNSMPVMGAFVFSDFIDKKLKTHEYHVESCGIPIPLTIDKIYTMKVVA